MTERGRVFYPVWPEELESVKQLAWMDALYEGGPDAEITVRELPNGKFLVGWYWAEPSTGGTPPAGYWKDSIE